jgi:tetratricopeptide (TPR) repeat protein
MSTRAFATLLSLSLSLSLAACHKPSEAPPPTSPDADLRALALTKPAGTTAVDEAIRKQVGRLEKEDGPADWWASLAQSWIVKARRSQDPGFYLSADAAAQLALKEDPRHTLAAALRVVVQVNQHRFAEARDQARALLRSQPENLVALGALADAQLELGDLDGAAETVQKMVDIKPDLSAYGRAAHLRWLHGDLATAKRFYRSAIDAGKNAREPEPATWMMVQVALVFWNQGDAEGAEAGFKSALNLLPNYPPALVGQAKVELSRGRFPEAVKLLEQAWAQSPLVETGWLLGDARAAAGDKAGAQKSWDDAVALGEKSDHLSMGSLLAAKGWRLPEALEKLEGELRVRPNQQVRDAYSWALYRTGRMQEARVQSDQVMSVGTPDPKYFFHAGAIRAAAGDPASGRALLERALKMSPAFDLEGARECRELLAKLDSRAAGAVAGAK